MTANPTTMAPPDAPQPARPEFASKERFFRYFQQEVLALQDEMSRLASVSPTERPDAIDHCLAGTSRLSDEVKDASAYIPAYDQRTYGEAIKALHDKLQNVRNELGQGKKKFKFTARKNASAISIGEAAEMAQNKRLLGPVHVGYSSGESSAAVSAFAPTPLELVSPGEEKEEEELVGGQKVLGSVENGSSGADGQGVVVSNLNGAHVVLPASTAQSARSATVSNVQRSVVDLSGPTINGSPFATLTLKNIRDSLVVCGRVTGPIHITGVERSVIVTSCRQYRMHSSKKVDVYLHCSSRPIIEDCETIRFAPLPQHFMTEDLTGSTNQWDQIDDFKWLKSEPSPNFTTLPDPERIPDTVWKVKVPGEPADLGSTLQVFGITRSS
ncbi:tubulin-specific chaperone-like protein c [Bimuria novae-zelandiae CBS 107.79]|uniref:Tubulin-specific chaperone-like protein c n=1 Tax=Bimuria novae-zelandiae CBS 107.79 TaxID=1447943 RepID=A0A6A5V5T8_9PLEO|nr:tubulin-specific chaperone-like protein c [Bimuria novae-zelandiae CBS 107.79]